MLSKNYSNFHNDFLSGGLSGALTGIFVAPAEYLKVVYQTTSPKILKQTIKSSDTHKNMIKTIPSFSFIFGIVCAIEYSINEQIRNEFNMYAGVLSSALTGALFLTAADHLMLRRKYKESTFVALRNMMKYNYTTLWAGFTPMVIREALYITSVMYIGIAIRDRIKKKLQRQNESRLYDISVTALGRFISGIPLTLISQPFDVLARQFQKLAYKNPQIRHNLAECLSSLYEENKLDPPKKSYYHPLFRGATPRIVLATFGGMISAGIFDEVRKFI